MFENIKEKILQLIELHKTKELTNNTRYNESGIYLIYIDNFDDDSIIPFYIGQTTDFQKRYKAHFSKIIALNKLSFDSYYHYMFKMKYSLYEGHFNYCKIFKYMVEHNCTLKDFHMIILDETEENLDELEKKYINEYLAPFFGFNQINTIFEYNKLKSLDSNIISEDFWINYFNYVLDDVENIDKYYDYGYTKFNYLYAIPNEFSFNQLGKFNIGNYDSVTNVIKKINNKIDVLKSKYPKNNNENIIENLKLQKEVIKPEENMLSNEITKIFVENINKPLNNLVNDKLITKLNKKKITECIKNYDNEEKTTISFIKEELSFLELPKYVDILSAVSLYKRKELDRLKLSKENHEISLKNQCIEENINEINNGRLKYIFPVIKYDLFPLKDLWVNKQYTIKIKDDEMYVYFTMSNSGRKSISEVIKIDLIANVNGKCVCQEFWINNSGVEVLNGNLLYKEYNSSSSFIKEPFTPRVAEMIVLDDHFKKIGMDYYFKYTGKYISPLSEIKNGINEYTFKNKKLYDIKDVFDIIDNYFIPSMKVTIASSESNKCLVDSFIDNKQIDYVKKCCFAKELLKKVGVI